MTTAVVTNEQHRTIDCDAAPFIPNGWSVRPEDQIKSAVRGDLIFNPSKITPYFSEGQKNDKTTVGHNLRKELEGKPVLTAHVLDYLLANKDLIPDSWKKNENGAMLFHFFWGMLYDDSYGRLFVRSLCWDDDVWCWSYRWIGGFFDGRDPAVLAM